MKLIYKPDTKPAELPLESNTETLNRVFNEWGNEFADTLKRVMNGNLSKSEKEIQQGIINNLIIGEDQMLGVVLSIASYILYEELADGEYKNLDFIITKKDMKAESFNEAYIRSRGKK